MKKSKKRPITTHPRAHKRKRSKNPLFTLVNPPDFPIPAGTTLPVEIVGTPFGFDVDMERMAADLIVQHALAECSPAEKVLIAALIPGFLVVIRKAPQDPEDKELCKCGHPRVSHYEHAVWCGWPECKCRRFEEPEGKS